VGSDERELLYGLADLVNPTPPFHRTSQLIAVATSTVPPFLYTPAHPCLASPLTWGGKSFTHAHKCEGEGNAPSSPSSSIAPSQASPLSLPLLSFQVSKTGFSLLAWAHFSESRRPSTTGSSSFTAPLPPPAAADQAMSTYSTRQPLP
jgi:hypothetical protein